MAGYSRVYCVGGHGGYLGSDGINPILFQILQGEGNRQWFEVQHFRRIRPLGRVRLIVPPGPYLPDNLLDACIAFFPQYFESCASLAQVEECVQSDDRIDFDMYGEPDGWSQLREEARPLFRHLIIYEAELRQTNGVEKSGLGWRFCGDAEWQDGQPPDSPRIPGNGASPAGQ